METNACNTDVDVTGEDTLERLIELAKAAGESTLAWYGRQDVGLAYKQDDSPLTQADLASHRILCDGLRDGWPAVPVLSEESAEVPVAERRSWPQFWLVDPLDGTKEFISRRDEFTVNVALIRHGEPVLGVVVAPVLGVAYGALQDVGAWKQEAHAPRKQIAVAPWQGGEVRVVASRSHVSAPLESFLEQLPAHRCINMGSSLKLCLVAEGAADLYPRFGPTMEWDTAAADCVVRAAGGRVTTLAGENLRYNKLILRNPSFIVAGDPPFPWHDCLPAGGSN